MIDNDPNKDGPCALCGESHRASRAERMFIAECERRGLPWQVDVIPDAAKVIATVVSRLLAPIGMSLEGNPGMMTYYAVTLAALSQAADHEAEAEIARATADLHTIPTQDTE